MAYELPKAGIAFEREKALPVFYGDVKPDVDFRCAFLIEDRVILVCKAVNKIMPIDKAQFLNYLKITQLTVGLLMNFNVLVLKNGFKRMVDHFPE